MEEKTKKILEVFIWFFILIISAVQGWYHIENFTDSFFHIAGTFAFTILCIYSFLKIRYLVKKKDV